MQNVVDNRILHGVWHDIKVFENQIHFEAYKRARALRKILTQDLLPIFVLPDDPNGITDEGIEYLLEVGFRSDAGMPVAQIAPWYAGLIDNAGFTGVAASDVMNSHTGWAECHTQYDETDRQTLAFGAVASRAITASVSFTFNATKTIQGIFVTDDNTKGGTTGTLWSTALFSTPPGLVSGNVLTANYTLTD